MFRTISDLPRLKRLWEASASGIHNDPAADFIRKMDAVEININLDGMDHVDGDVLVDMRPVGPVSHGERDSMRMRLLGKTMLLITDTDDPAGLQRAPIVIKQGDWKVMLRTDSPSGPSARKRVMHKAESEGRDVVIVDTKGEPVEIAHRDPARMHFIAEQEREWLHRGTVFDANVEHAIPQGVARETTLYADEKKRAAFEKKAPRIVPDRDHPRVKDSDDRDTPRHWVASRAVSAESDYKRALERAHKAGCILEVLDALPPMPPPEADARVWT